MDFNSPKFFPPNFLQSLFAVAVKAFYCMVIMYDSLALAVFTQIAGE